MNFECCIFLLEPPLCVDSDWVIKRINFVLNLFIKSGSPSPSKSFSFVNTFYHFNFCDKSFSLPQIIFFINSLWIDLGLPRIFYLRQPTIEFATFNSYHLYMCLYVTMEIWNYFCVLTFIPRGKYYGVKCSRMTG